MIKILGEQSYRGFSAAMSEAGAQPVYVGRLAWPGEAVPLDSVIKLYEHATCGVANEAIGYVANAIRKVPQPKYGGILLLSKEALPDFQYDVTPYVDEDSGLAVCWATSLEQNAKPFSYFRRLSSFTERQILAFYESSFSQTLVGVDHVTGNSDRHEGNFLYIDEMRYLAIDQGSVGGGAFWHTMWPDAY